MLAIAFLYKAVMRFMTSPNVPNSTQTLLIIFIAHNALLIPLKWVTAKVKLEKGLGLNSTAWLHKLLLPDFGPHREPLKP